MARIVRAGEASSEAERRNEGSTKCVRNPEKREFAMQTRDEKCYAFLAFFAKQKATLKNKNSKLDICPNNQLLSESSESYRLSTVFTNIAL